MVSTRAHLSDEALLARLVAFDSTSHRSNQEIADFICNYLDHPRIAIERLPSPCGTKVNLMVHVGPSVDPVTRDGLTLSGHMDVVPATEPDWHSDPFTLTEHDDRWVGRGACDMKGFDAIAVNLAREAAEAELAEPLVLIITYDEEVGTVGAHDFAHAWPAERPLPRRAVIGEPTSLEVVRMHKGHAQLRLTTEGLSAHSGYPHLGRSAIEPTGRVIVALEALRRRLAEERPDHHEHFPDVPFVALNMGTITGGSAINIVPDRCVLEIGVRVLPGMTVEPVVERVRATVTEALDATDVTWDLVLNGQSPPMLTDEADDLYRQLCDWRRQQTTRSASYATDAGWLQQCGLDCLIFGPGSIEVAHKPNEFMPKDEYREGGALFRRLLHERCVAA